MAANEFEKALSAALADLKKVNEEQGVKQKGGKTYTMVSHRIEVFRRHFPGFCISTDMEKWEPESNGAVVFKATIANYEGRALATGHAEEFRDDGHVNATSAVENCETSAIGRALAAFGLHGGEFASADELALAIGSEAVGKIELEPEPEEKPKAAAKAKPAAKAKAAEKLTVTWPDGSVSEYDDCESIVQEAFDNLTDCQTVEDIDAMAKAIRPHKPAMTADQNERMTAAFSAQRLALAPKEEPEEEKPAPKKAPAKKAPAKKTPAKSEEESEDGPGWEEGDDEPSEYEEDDLTSNIADYNKDGLPLVDVTEKQLSLVYAIFSAFLPACESKDEMIRWWKANTAAIEWLQKYGPNLYSSLIDEFKARKAELEG